MGAWLTVYCARPVRNVIGKDILLALDFEDAYLFAEQFGIEEDMIAAALANLRVVRNDSETRFAVRYLPDDSRSVRVHFWLDPRRVAREVAEARRNLGGAGGLGPTRIRWHLSRTVEVAAIELSLPQLRDMGIVLGRRIADLLAAVGDGLVRDHNGAWWAMGGSDSSELIHE